MQTELISPDSTHFHHFVAEVIDACTELRTGEDSCAASAFAVFEAALGGGISAGPGCKDREHYAVVLVCGLHARSTKLVQHDLH